MRGLVGLEETRHWARLGAALILALLALPNPAGAQGDSGEPAPADAMASGSDSASQATPPSTAFQSVAGSIANPVTSTPAELYFHVLGFEDFPINTQPPEDTWVFQDALGLGTASSSCAPPIPGVGFVGREYHTWYGYLSPAPVDYNGSHGQPRLAPQRGLSFDAILDPSVPWVVHWYLETRATSGAGAPVDAETVPVAIPNVVVKVTVRAGEGVAIDNAAYNSGEVLASGQTEPETLQPSAPNHSVGDDGHHIYAFDVPLSITRPVLPRSQGFNVRIDAYVDNPACNQGTYLMPNLVDVRTDGTHRPRMELATLDPLRIAQLRADYVPLAGILVFQAQSSSPWGPYDASNATLELVGPATIHLQYFQVPRYHEHGRVYSQRDETWVWNYTADQAPAGEYVARLTVRNFQDTATANATLPFRLGDGVAVLCTAGPVGSPSGSCQGETDAEAVWQQLPNVWLGPLGAAFLVLAWMARRR